MKYSPLFFCVTAILFATPQWALAGKGEDVYKRDCTGCHGSEVFTRADRRIKNLASLQKRVRQCSYAVEAKWFDEDVNAVTEYLNKQFYKF